MSAKEMFFDFLHVVILVLLILFFLFYIVLGDRLGIFYTIMKIAAPLVFVTTMFLIKMQFTKKAYRRMKRERVFEIVVYLNFWDKLKAEILIFLIPLVVLIVPIYIEKKLDAMDLLQAIFSFVLAFLLYKLIFKKEKF